jgi:hypothetical protein
MKYISLIAVLFITLNANAKHSSIKVPYNICLKYPYGNTIGGTIYSKLTQKRKLYKYALNKANYTEEKALKIIQREHPTLNIKDLNIYVRNCFVYFRATNGNQNYYFDARTLALQTKDQL